MTHPGQRPDIAFIPTPDDAIAAMLSLAELSPADRVYDLGCGDGRLLRRAVAQAECRGVGVDVDDQLLQVARTQAQAEGVGEQLQFVQANLYAVDLTEATVVLLYLLPHLNLRLRPRLQTQLPPGARVISHQFDMGDWPPETHLALPDSEEESVIYRWVI